MKQSPMNPAVDAFLNEEERWRREFEKLRQLALACGLTEELKWGKPCYSLAGANVVLIHGFKEYCALLFMKGALMKDPEGMLVQQTENVQAARQLRFRTLAEIVKFQATVKAYIQEAIAVEHAGLEVTMKKTSEFKMPEEFRSKLAAAPELKKAFAALTPGRQRGYLLYFAGAKQAKTREARIEKCASRILQGKGLDDE